jgi:hypothetical protein
MHVISSLLNRGCGADAADANGPGSNEEGSAAAAQLAEVRSLTRKLPLHALTYQSKSEASAACLARMPRSARVSAAEALDVQLYSARY